VGLVVHKILLECYPDGSGVPSPDTLHYTLGDFPQDQFWDQGMIPEGLLDTDIPVVKKLVLRHADKYNWIKKEHTTIFAFLPLPHTDKAESLEPKAVLPTEATKTCEVEGQETRWQLSPLQPQQRSAQTQPQESSQVDLPPMANSLRNPILPEHQSFVRIPDTWPRPGLKKPAYTKTMPSFTSLGSLMDDLAQLLSIPTHAFRIQYGGKILIYHRSLAAQGVTKSKTVWMLIGGLFGEADTKMGDDPHLAGSLAATPHRPAQTHSSETQYSIDEWIDRLRINNPLTQDLATVNMLMTALILTKDLSTTAIMESLNEGNEDNDTHIYHISSSSKTPSRTTMSNSLKSTKSPSPSSMEIGKPSHTPLKSTLQG